MTDPLAALRDALRDRYDIEGEIGRGGMATVHRAHDLRHDRSVALKLLHPELAASLGPERFQREIRLAARLQHPHILTVLDSGESAGRLWFTMPFIDGETLRDRLQREGQLPLPDALRIAREAADALDYAHRHNVVHRDIKPENILLSDGHALVADFGIARSLGAAGSAITEPGMAVGTPAYMSPEQASGAAEVGPRTDIYSLGVVLYEMLAGEAPFTGPSAQAVISRALTETPRPLKIVRATVPSSVQALVAKTMARSPADRHAAAGELVRALDDALAVVRSGEQQTQPGLRAHKPPARRLPLALTLGLGVLLGGGVLFAWRQSHSGRSSDESRGPKRLAVIPFENMGAPEDAYFADGVAEEVRGKLATLPGLQVTARSSSSQYRGSTKTPGEIGRDLGVEYLLTGTVRWEKGEGGNRVRVSPELIEVATGTSKWRQPFDASITDVFQVQGDIADRVADAMDVTLGATELAQLGGRPTTNLAAYQAFLQGDAVSDALGVIDPATMRQALALYEQAVALDSAFALAWARISRARTIIYSNTEPSPEMAQAARAAGERALALDPNLPEAYLALGSLYGFIENDAPRALATFERGRRLGPNSAELLTAQAQTEQRIGQWDSALVHFRQALAVDPRSVDTVRRLARTLLWLRQYPSALDLATRGLALSPTNTELLETRAMVYLAQGDLSGAREVLRNAPREMAPTRMVADFGNYWDLFWVLDNAQQLLLLQLGPGEFDDNRAVWAMVRAQTLALRGDASARAYADTARLEFTQGARAAPADPQQHLFLGLSLALLGRKAEAIREAEIGAGLREDDDFFGKYYHLLLARVYTLTGESDKAFDTLDRLVTSPFYVSRAWLTIDPSFEPLRKLPRFQRLVNGTSGTT